MKKRLYRFIFIWVIAVFSPVFATTSLNIAVASNFAHTFLALQPIFEKKFPIKLHPSFASSGQLYLHIIHGAPFDVFLSADLEHVTRLENNSFAIPRSRFIYAVGELVLCLRQDMNIKPGMNTLTSPAIKTIAIANPITAPYGMATKMALKQMKLWPILKPKLIYGENIGQVTTFLASGNVDAGFISRSQWLHINTQTKKGPNILKAWVVPAHLYDPIYQYATRLKNSTSEDDAHIFLTFLKTKEAQQIIEATGYKIYRG